MDSTSTESASACLGYGIYTIPDTSRILGLPLPKLQRWVSGYSRILANAARRHEVGVIDDGTWGTGPDRGLNFYALIELFTFATLRDLGLSAQKIRKARSELSERFGTRYPFASHRLLSDGKQILVVLDSLEEPIVMILNAHGQMALRQIVEPFCRKLDFCEETSLALRYWPLGRQHAVVVDPRHAFGRPTIVNTNIPTEALFQFIRAGESIKDVAREFDLPESTVDDAVAFERKAA